MKTTILQRKVGIVGNGGIGTYLAEKRLRPQDIDARFYPYKKTRTSFGDWLDEKRPQAIFLAISTRDKGQAARDYILACVKRNIPVITCEKGAFAYHAEDLSPYIHLIGTNAVVGGGTGILKYVKKCLKGSGATRPVTIHVVLNGTLNLIMSEPDILLGCRKAQDQGFAEPGASNPLQLFNGELVDVVLKTCAFYNIALAGRRFISPRLFMQPKLAASDLERLIRDKRHYRMVVSFSNHGSVKEYARFGQRFHLDCIDGWNIAGEFRQLTPESGLLGWLPGREGNAVRIEHERGLDEAVTHSGLGAGHGPTTGAMMEDYNELRR